MRNTTEKYIFEKEIEKNKKNWNKIWKILRNPLNYIFFYFKMKFKSFLRCENHWKISRIESAWSVISSSFSRGIENSLSSLRVIRQLCQVKYKFSGIHWTQFFSSNIKVVDSCRLHEIFYRYFHQFKILWKTVFSVKSKCEFNSLAKSTVTSFFNTETWLRKLKLYINFA